MPTTASSTNQKGGRRRIDYKSIRSFEGSLLSLKLIEHQSPKFQDNGDQFSFEIRSVCQPLRIGGRTTNSISLTIEGNGELQEFFTGVAALAAHRQDQ